jgi:hypothetical protein
MIIKVFKRREKMVKEKIIDQKDKPTLFSTNEFYVDIDETSNIQNPRYQVKWQCIEWQNHRPKKNVTHGCLDHQFFCC